MKRIALLSGLIFSGLFIAPELVGQAVDGSWQLLHEQNGVRMETMQVECDMNPSFDQEVILLRIINRGDKAVLVDWDVLLWYGGVCKTCDDPRGEYHRTIKLGAGELREADCSEFVDQTYRLFVRFTDPAYRNLKNQQVLTKYEIANFKVTDISSDQ